MKQLDLNADIGEGFSFDQELCDYITSANISCGAHAGSLKDRTAAISFAMDAGVSIGAHPGYPDRQNFGRQPLNLSFGDLRETLFSQLDSFYQLVQSADTQVSHVKLHGALYNQAASSLEFAETLLSLLLEFDGNMKHYALAGSAFHRACLNHEVQVVSEGFIDRRYQEDGQLVSRSIVGSLLTAEEAIQQAIELALSQPITTLSKVKKMIHCDSLCLHGDNKDALCLAKKVYAALDRLPRLQINS